MHARIWRDAWAGFRWAWWPLVWVPAAVATVSSGFAAPTTWLELAQLVLTIFGVIGGVAVGITWVAHRWSQLKRYTVVQLQWPLFLVRARLRREASHVARDMHAYRKAQPLWDDAEWRAHLDRLDAAGSEEERTKLFREYSSDLSVRAMRERQELAEHFGARVRALLYEFERRGLVNSQDAARIDAFAQAPASVQEAAVEIEAIAKRL